MNKKLFYLLALLTLLPLAPAQGMKKNTTGKKPRNRGIGEMASGLSFAFYCPWLIVFNYLKPSFQDERFPHGSVLGDANGPWSNILEFFEFKDLINFRCVNKKYSKIVSQFCQQTGRPVLKIKLKQELFEIEGLSDFKNELKPLKNLLGNNMQIALDCSHYVFIDCLQQSFSKITNDQLGVVVELFKDNLQSLKLSFCKQLTNRGLEYIAENLPNLQSLNLSSCAQITDQGLQHLAKLENLKDLDLGSNIKITDENLKAVAENLSSLQTLNLSDCYEITDKGLKAIAKNLPNLQTLNLSWCDKITDEGLKHLTKLKNLQTLNLFRCNKITDKGLTAVAKNLTKLQTLDLFWCRKITDEGMRLLKQANPNLEIKK